MIFILWSTLEYLKYVNYEIILWIISMNYENANY